MAGQRAAINVARAAVDDLERVVQQEWGRLVALLLAQFRRIDMVDLYQTDVVVQ